MEAYPLSWPLGYKRTKIRKDSRFSQTAEGAQIFLRNELTRLGTRSVIISSNVPVRKDGYIYSDMSATKIDDPGVAIYFRYKDMDVSMCCDTYSRVWENIYALGKGIESIRGMNRWGVSEFIERAFTGFKALPENTVVNGIGWWTVLDLPMNANVHQIKEAYRKLRQKYHPDRPDGNADKFVQVEKAYMEALSKFTGVA